MGHPETATLEEIGPGQPGAETTPDELTELAGKLRGLWQSWQNHYDVPGYQSLADKLAKSAEASLIYQRDG